MQMTFTAPGPWEADAFYAQAGMAAAGLSLDRWPVGTGPYMLTEFVQDRRHVMVRNPHYRGEPYPCEGMPGDREAGLLTARITWVEVRAAIARREREVPQAEEVWAQARTALSALWPHIRVIELTPAVAARAGEYAETLALWGYDAVQLASGL
jgi:hypothetical protein